MRSLVFSLALAALVTSIAAPASAQSPADKAADVAFQEGRSALAKGNLELACGVLTAWLQAAGADAGASRQE